MVRRIHIIGSTGSGKSYVAGILSRRLGIPAFDLDELFWDRSSPTYGVRTVPEDRDRRLAEIVAGEAWITEGVYYQWVGDSFDRADVILALVPSVWVRDWRVVRRFIKRKLGLAPSKRESLRDLVTLLRWNHQYDANNYAKALAFITERGRQVVVCKTIADVLAAIGPDGQ